MKEVATLLREGKEEFEKVDIHRLKFDFLGYIIILQNNYVCYII